MEVKGVSTGSFFVNSTKSQKTEKAKTSPKDSIEISTEARDIVKTELSQQQVNAIREKIASGFYNSDDVLNKVAEKVLGEINK